MRWHFLRPDFQKAVLRCFFPEPPELIREQPDESAGNERPKMPTRSELGRWLWREQRGCVARRLPLRSNAAAALPNRGCLAVQRARAPALIRAAISPDAQRAQLSVARRVAHPIAGRDESLPPY